MQLQGVCVQLCRLHGFSPEQTFPGSSRVAPQDGDVGNTTGKALYFPHRRSNPVRIHLKHTLCWQSQVHGLKHCGNKCTRGASVLLTFESEVRKLWRGSLAGQQRAGSRQFRWWNVRLACFCWAAATVAAGPADVSEHRPPNAGASCAVKVQPVTLTGARRNGPTHHFSPGEEEPFYPRHEVSLTPCLESFTAAIS